jgi:hypothetical protein
MVFRFATSIVCFFSSLVLAADNPPQKITGQQIVIKMTGRLAAEYSNRAGIGAPGNRPAGYKVSVLGTILKQLPNQQYQVESETTIPASGTTKPRIVKLMVAVDSNVISTSTTPKGTEVVSVKPSVPAANTRNEPFRTVQLDAATLERVTTTKDHTSHRLELSELKGVTIQTWQLIDELAECVRRYGEQRVAPVLRPGGFLLFEHPPAATR